MKTCCFIGHRNVLNQEKVTVELLPIVEKLILEGYDNFLVGTHGNFDSIAQSACYILKAKYPQINITLILSNLALLDGSENSKISMELYKKFNSKFYDIENVYYKNRITVSNQKMIDENDFVIAYVNEDFRQSGAGKSLKYAKKHNKNILNIYKKM